MNGIRCRECKQLNTTSALLCDNCGNSFSNLPHEAYVSVPAADLEQTQTATFSPPLFSNQYIIPADNETGAKIHLWYRIYCGVFILSAIVLFCVAVDMMVSRPGTYNSEAPENQFISGVFWAIVAPIFGAIYAIALFSPRKPWAWVYGIVLLAIGIATCCFLPSLILLIYWAKEETRVYFGRK